MSQDKKKQFDLKDIGEQDDKIDKGFVGAWQHNKDQNDLLEAVIEDNRRPSFFRQLLFGRKRRYRNFFGYGYRTEVQRVQDEIIERTLQGEQPYEKKKVRAPSHSFTWLDISLFIIVLLGILKLLSYISFE